MPRERFFVDLGGDKFPAAFKTSTEANPFLEHLDAAVRITVGLVKNPPRKIHKWSWHP